MKILDFIQGDRHSIDLVLAIHRLTKTVDESIGWKDIEKWINENLNTTLSDQTFRKRRNELMAQGLLELTPIDRTKNKVKLTEKGRKFATIVEEFYEKLKAFEGENKSAQI